MTDRRLLEDVESVKRLASHLAECPEVKALDTQTEREAWSLAHSFADLEESFLEILKVQLPRLITQDIEPAESFDLLLDIGEELRHILYHITHTQFYNYLCEQKASDQQVEE